MKALIILLGFTTLISACGGYSSLATNDVVGMYRGTIPCADCQGIDITLEFLGEKLYRSTSVYLGKNGEARRDNGIWSTSGNIITLMSNDDKQIFEKVPEGLRMLGHDGRKIESSMSELYILKKIVKEEHSPDSRTAFWQKEFEKGNTFAARGTEPFWSVDISSSKVTFRQADEANPLIIPLPEARTYPNDDVEYSATTESGILSVRIKKQECTDAMSGEKYPYTVIVAAKGKEYKGCGRYLYDTRIHDMWALTSGEGILLSSGTRNKIPMLDIQPNNERVMGNGSCNTITGRVQVQGNTIKFSGVAATRMACPEMNTETAFFKHLDNTKRYTITNGELILLNKDGGKLLTFIHID